MTLKKRTYKINNNIPSPDFFRGYEDAWDHIMMLIFKKGLNNAKQLIITRYNKLLVEVKQDEKLQTDYLIGSLYSISNFLERHGAVPKGEDQD